MSKIEKLKERLRQRPKDFTYAELVAILNASGYVELKGGKTSGSRRAFVNSLTNHVIRLHKPHPTNLLKMYQINEIIEELSKYGYI